MSYINVNVGLGEIEEGLGYIVFVLRKLIVYRNNRDLRFVFREVLFLKSLVGVLNSIIS